MSYYKHHVFFCTNQREQAGCCENCGASALRAYAKQRCKDLDLNGPGGIRINTAGCLDRCALGPVMVVYPQGVWYSYVDEEDVEEIIQEHLINGRTVERLLID